MATMWLGGIPSFRAWAIESATGSTRAYSRSAKSGSASTNVFRSFVPVVSNMFPGRPATMRAAAPMSSAKVHPSGLAPASRTRRRSGMPHVSASSAMLCVTWVAYGWVASTMQANPRSSTRRRLAAWSSGPTSGSTRGSPETSSPPYSVAEQATA